MASQLIRHAHPPTTGQYSHQYSVPPSSSLRPSHRNKTTIPPFRHPRLPRLPHLQTAHAPYATPFDLSTHASRSMSVCLSVVWSSIPTHLSAGVQIGMHWYLSRGRSGWGARKRPPAQSGESNSGQVSWRLHGISAGHSRSVFIPHPIFTVLEGCAMFLHVPA